MFRRLISIAIAAAWVSVGVWQPATADEFPAPRKDGLTTVTAQPAEADPVVAARVDALRAAKLRGDADEVRSIRETLGWGVDPTHAPVPPATQPWPVVRQSILQRGVWQDDRLVSNPTWPSTTPAMAARIDGTLYVVVDDMSGHYLDIYVSSDDGSSWAYRGSIAGVEDLTNPSIAIGEGNVNRLLIAFEEGRYSESAGIYVYWEDLDTGVSDVVLVDSNPWIGILHPQICVDSPEYDVWWPYITYVKGILGFQDWFDLEFTRSFDYGDTWTAPIALSSQVTHEDRPDIDYGDQNLYVTYTEWFGPGDRDVYLRRSSDLGATWGGPVTLAYTGDDEYDPRVAATNGGDAAVVAYTRKLSDTDSDIEQYVSTDAGDNWSWSWLPFTSDTEVTVDLTVSVVAGRLHAAFWRSGDIVVTDADHTAPGTWSTPELVNEGNAAQYLVRPTVTVNPTRAEEAAVAWADMRVDPEYRVYFDAAYRLNLLPAGWVSLDGTPEGTPADIILDDMNSTPDVTVFDLVIHGLWMQPRYHDGEHYQEIIVPGLGSIGMDRLGAPDLPVFRFDLALATAAGGITTSVAETMEMQQLEDILVWPQPIDALNDILGTEEIFQRDDEIYGQDTPWPGIPSEGGSREGMMGVPGAGGVMYPIQWNPLTRELFVHNHVRYWVEHPGPTEVFPEMTKDRARAANANFLNWAVVEPHFPVNLFYYAAQYLFIYPAAYANEILPLANQKRARGFWVTELTTESIGSTCGDFRTAITNWYTATPSIDDHYCLLVGDTGTIPMCTSPVGDDTDDPYGSTNGSDLNEEVYVGRLSVDSETDAADQVQKILTYEDNPPIGADYFDDALLVAHKQGAPGKYQGAHQSVLNGTYSVAPTFHQIWGSAAGSNNATVSAAINGGMGLVAYRGHGSETEWWEWNLFDANYDNTEVFALTNGDSTTVVWSFACVNAALSTEDSIAEAWLENENGGAVAHYGATVDSWTPQNHELDRQMFKAVYDLGLITHAQAIEYAEKQMAKLAGSDNAWMYMLLGDPDMQIRRRNPLVLAVTRPDIIAVCETGNCTLSIRVRDENMAPLEGLLVAAWKPEGTPVPEGDEVFDNRYTDPDGWAHVPASPTTEGWLYYTVQDDEGNAVLDSIEVQLDPIDVEDVVAVVRPPLTLRAHPTIANASTRFQFGRELDGAGVVQVFDVGGRRVRSLDVVAGMSNVVWDARDEAGHRVSPGVYFARIMAENQELNTRVLVVR